MSITNYEERGEIINICEEEKNFNQLPKSTREQAQYRLFLIGKSNEKHMVIFCLVLRASQKENTRESS